MTTTSLTDSRPALSDLDPALAAILEAPLPDIATGDCYPPFGLIRAIWLRPHLHGLHPYLVECPLKAAIDPIAILPSESTVLRYHRRNATREVLALVDNSLIAVEAFKRFARLWVSGVDREAVELIVTQIKDRLPEAPDDKAVRVTFWHAGRNGWSRTRDIEVPRWTDIATNYPAATREAMARLIGYRPAANAGGRLVLWHGPAGTGKTTAVRALFDAWRKWASAHVVSDSDRLLNDADYLAEVVLDGDEKTDHWRLIVIEDAEELLRHDARSTVGTALGRLLNAADGLLGQGLRVLFLLTTNERVGEMHPALLRPGRCLAKIEFPAFNAAEASELVGERVTVEMTLAEIMERRGDLTRMQMAIPEARPGLYL